MAYFCYFSVFPWRFFSRLALGTSGCLRSFLLLAFVLLAFVFSSLRSLLLAFVVCLLLAFVFCLRAFCLACVPCCSRSSFASCLRSFLLAFVFSLACVRCCSCPSFQRQGQRTGPRAKKRRPRGHKASRTQRPGGLRGAP